MFDLSLAELLLIVIVAVVFIGPKELPVVLRALAKGLRALKSLANEIRHAFDEVTREAGVDELRRDITFIRGDDGKLYESYDVDKVLEGGKKNE